MSPLLTAALVLQVAAGAQLPVNDGDEVSVAVGPSGVTVQLPEYVRIVTPSTEYQVKALVPPAPPPAPTAVGAASGAQAAAASVGRTDVRVFLVRAAKPTPLEQPVTFVMGEDKALTVRFVPGGPGEDAFVDLKWQRRSSATSSRTMRAEGFLAGERVLLMAMLRDEPVLGRKVAELPVSLPGYPNLEVVLLRTYEADGLAGGVYTIKNTSDKTVEINQTVLAIGKPNRAILTQMDHSTLRSCKEDSSPDPRGTGCVSAVRIVSRLVRGVSGTALRVDTAGGMPFVLAPVKSGERR